MFDFSRFLLYNSSMGRPRGIRNTAMVNGRVTAEQMEWLQTLADELSGNLSAALRQTITDARALEMVRTSFNAMRKEHPDFAFPAKDEENVNSNTLMAYLLSTRLTETDEQALRDLEEGRSGEA
jgi:hypothetical protein